MSMPMTILKTLVVTTLLLLAVAGCDRLAEAHHSQTEKPAAKPAETAKPADTARPAGDVKAADATTAGQTWTCAVEGMHCGGCADTVRQALLTLPGVEDAQVNLEGKSATVKMKAGVTFPEAQARDVLDADNYKLGQCQPARLTN